MPLIYLTTLIKAPQQRVFDLSRSIDMHMRSMQHTNEKAVAGKMSGLIEKGETVTWQAKHFFKKRSLTVHITEMKPYEFFIDEMLQGDFKMMKHKHRFAFSDGITTMTDEFMFQIPFGITGRLACSIYLTSYMRKLLEQRNLIIKDYAEKGSWKIILPA
jgi:ligand-binding SRPBCC domain-containing protein